MKGRLRLIACLSVAAVLSVFLLYAAFAPAGVAEPVVEMDSFASQAQLAASRDVQLVGVAQGPIRHVGENGLRFRIVGRGKDGATLDVDYRGAVPDAFAAGRNIVVTGRVSGGTVKARDDSLLTKCPSKYQSKGS